MNDYYQLLGVVETATETEIRTAFRARVQESLDDQPRFAALNEAFETLRDTQKRADYDRQRAIGRAKATAATAGTVAGRTTMGDTTVRGEQTAMGSSTLMEGATIQGAAGQSAGATVAGAVSGGALVRTVGGVSLPVRCAIALSACPLLSGQTPPDEGFCAECGLSLQSELGAQASASAAPTLTDPSGRVFSIKFGENTVGREGADIALPDRTVSRRHARLILADGPALTLEDLGSTNGTKLDGAVLSASRPTRLLDGAKIAFGSVTLRVTIPGDPGVRGALPAASADTSRKPVAAVTGSGGSYLIAADGKSLPLTAAAITVGRRPGNDLVISTDSFVSGSHAKLVFEGGVWNVVDVGSTNGTRVNGQKLAPNVAQPIRENDRVQFGQTEFVLSLVSGAVKL